MNKQRSMQSILATLVASLTLCLVITIIVLVPAQAGTTIVVTTTDDELNTDGDCSLREAIKAANTDSIISGCPAGNGADTIVLPSGTYRLTTGLTEYITIESELILEGAGSATTIIDGEKLSGVFYTSGPLTATISGVTIQNGQILGSGGGGILNTGPLMLVNSVVISNTASSGGGIYNQDGNLTLMNSTVGNNSASTGGGGGIYNKSGAVTLINGTVSYNHADSFIGGGISNQYGGTLILINSTVSQNNARTVGGITADDESPITLINSTIYSNTMTSFSAPGGIYSAGTVNIKNTIIAGNTKAGGNPSDCFATLTSQGYNLIQETTNCTIIGDTTGNQTGVSPSLGSLEDNGGPTLTHALLAGSPAIDAGNPSGCTDHIGNQLVTDQRGFPRAIDGDDNGSVICDIGAYELWEPSHWVFLPLVQR